MKEKFKKERREKLPRKKFRSGIGGQAVLEGVMMRGESSMATAVRDENGNIVVESKRVKPAKERNIILRLPVIRGVVGFFGSMFTGVGTLMRSAAVFDAEEEPGKFEKWLAEKCKINVMSLIMTFSMLLGLALAVGLFFILPQVITSAIAKAFEQPPSSIVLNLIDGAIRMAIFIAYIALVSLMKDIRRVFMYHGAEHRTISCYERGMELTVENVQKQSTIHDRCGTTFMVLVMVVSILLFSLTGWSGNLGIRILIRLALLPAVAGVSYEILKFLALFDNPFVNVLKAPGLALQKLTTRKPDDSMAEVAIAAFETVMRMDADPTIAETTFDVKLVYKKVKEEIDGVLKDREPALADWIMCEVTGVERSGLGTLSHIRQSQADKAREYAGRVAAGEPLQYVLGYTDFYGIKIKTDPRALIPRPETEELVETASKLLKDGASVLDLCTGSGAVALALLKLRPDLKVASSDVSDDALALAKENAESNGENVRFIKSDMFENIDETFDAIICNPPYIETAELASLDAEVKDFEPLCALDGGADGLDFYRVIAKEAPKRLNAGGRLFLEIGSGQAAAVAELLEGFDVEIKKDMQGLDRIAAGVLK